MPTLEAPAEHRPLKDVSTYELQMRYVLVKSMQLGMVNALTPEIRRLSRHAPTRPGERNPQTVAVDGTISMLQSLAKFAMEQTAVKVFFGGIGEEANKQTAIKLIDKYIGTIIDNAAPEDSAGQYIEERIARAMKGYDKALDVCSALHKHYEDDPSRQGYISAAFKLSTVAEATDLEIISDCLNDPENKDKPWGQKKIRGENIDPATLRPNETVAYWEFEKIYERVKPFFERAHAMGIEVYADAEETRINPAILELCGRLNRDGIRPTVTVQAYLRNADETVDELMKLDPPPNIKLVRGAYMHDLIDQHHIWPTKEDTDACYNRLLTRLYNSDKIDVLTVATHNQKSRHIAEDMVRESSGKNHTRVVFATLMGMGNDLIAPPRELAIEERKYQPSILDENKIAVLGAIAYFGRRGKEFMSVTDPAVGKTRAELELEQIEAEIKRRGVGADGIKKLTDTAARMTHNFFSKRWKGYSEAARA